MIELDLRHYSPRQIETLSTKVVGAKAPFKPRGLWLSVGDEWKRWCEAQGYGIETLGVEHKITLRPDANVLVLTSAAEIHEFSDKYASSEFGSMATVNWTRVAQDYQGVIIAPYIWECRFNPMWYYGWDVASGCIWDTSAIAEIKALEAQPHEA